MLHYALIDSNRYGFTVSILHRATHVSYQCLHSVLTSRFPHTTESSDQENFLFFRDTRPELMITTEGHIVAKIIDIA